jgi:AcrR family transcriptional regulator
VSVVGSAEGVDALSGRTTSDAATRERLLIAATRLFGDRGFASVTVRDLCREAGASVAAVNYHFGDKLGLYREVVERAVASVSPDPTTAVPNGMDPGDRIRHFVRTYLPRLASPGGDAVSAQKLMRQEMTDPTPLAPWIAERVILPRIRFLAAAIAELLGTDDPDDARVRRCVLGLQAHCLAYTPNNFRRVAVPGWPELTAEEVTEAADHIVEFTLAGIDRIRTAGTVR